MKYLSIFLEFGKIGIGICFDLRFPEFSRFYQEQGCSVIVWVTFF